jgi:arginase
MVSHIRVIAVPYELDRLRAGVGRGPERLLELGAEDALATSGATVRTEIVELQNSYGGSVEDEVDASFELIRLVSGRVGAAVDEGAFPVVLSGSCFAAVGVVAGLVGPPPSVVWFDAHADFNNPETAVFGYFDGMGLAVMTGSAWQGLLATVPGARPLPESAVVLAGARAFDPPEERRLRASAITHLSAGELSAPDALVSAVEALTPPSTSLYIHVDLDVLDAGVAPVNVYSAPDGLDADQLEDLLGTLIQKFSVRAVSLTAYDPDCDADGLLPPIAFRLLRTIAERA